MSELPFTTTELYRAERTEYAVWGLRVRAAGGLLADFGAARALLAPGDRSPLLNRVALASAATLSQLDAIEGWFARHHAAPQWDILPTPNTAPLLPELHRRGYQQRGFKSILAAWQNPASLPTPSLPPGMRLQPLDSHHHDAITALYMAAFGLTAEAAPLRYHGFRQALAAPGMQAYGVLVGDTLAGFGLRYDLAAEQSALLATAAVHPDYRGRHLQTALLLARMQAYPHATPGQAVFFTAQCTPYGTSQANMERVGLRLLATKALWRKHDEP